MLTILVELRSQKGKHSIQKNTLIDSGANTNCIHWKLVNQWKVNKEKLAIPLIIQNADDTKNINRKITHKVLLAIKTQGHQEVLTFYISNLGHNDIILGYTWLHHHNPSTNWQQPAVSFDRCPPLCSFSLGRKWHQAYGPKAIIKAGQRHNP